MSPSPPPAPRFRYLFTIASGRSGTRYLTDLLGADSRVDASHEPAPKIHADFLHRTEREGLAATYADRRFKADAVRDRLAAGGSAGKTVYAETSHMFVKTFGDVVARELTDVGVIHLRRELALVVKSFVELGIFTDRNPAWPDWMPPADSPGRAVEPAAPLADLPPAERVVAHLVDIEARGERFRREHPEIPVFEARLEALVQSPGEAERLFAWAGLDFNAEAVSRRVRRTNDRAHRKDLIATPIDRETCAAAVDRYLSRMRARGIPVPAGLAVAPWEGNPPAGHA